MKRFIHPGIGCSKDTLEVLKRKAKEGREPWSMYYKGLLNTKYAKLDFEIQKVEKIENDNDIARFRLDCEAAWSQMVLYYVTGDRAYLEIPKQIFMWYGKRQDFFVKNFTDSYIKLGKYVYTICAAGDMARDTLGEDLILAMAENALKPIVFKSLHFNGYFMNQHTYSIIGVMAYSVLTDDIDLYKEVTEWALMNKSAENQGRNGALGAVIRKVDSNPVTGEKCAEVIELVEMGRDQDHAEGNLNNLLMMVRTMEIQHTKVNCAGEADEKGVSPIHFLDDRLIKGFELYAKYNMGMDIDWAPAFAESTGVKVIYDSPSPEGRGNFSINGMAAAKFTYASIGMSNEYISAVYDCRYPYFRKSAESGQFIETLHNYAFDFWIGLSDKSEDTEKRDWDEKAIKNISVNKKTSVKDGEKIKLFIPFADGLCVRLKTHGWVDAAVVSMGERREFTVPDTMGEWRNVVFDVKIKSLAEIECAGGQIEFDRICQGEDLPWYDEREIFDGIVGEEIEIDNGYCGKSSIVKYIFDEPGEKIIKQCAIKGELIKGRKVTVNIARDKISAIKKAAENYKCDEAYEKESADSVKKALESGNLKKIRDAAENARLLEPKIEDGSLDITSICTANINEFLKIYKNSDPKVFGSVWNEGEEFIMDFGEKFRIVPKKFGIQARSGFPTRVNGSAFYGSADKANWIKLTTEAKITDKMQILKAEKPGGWRYIKVKREDCSDVKVLDIGVLRIYGNRIELFK